MMMEKFVSKEEPPLHTDDSQLITEIKPHDVLLGRGAGPNEHTGNVKFRLIVAKQKKQYMDTTNRQVKNKIAHKTIRLVKAQKGRFLQKVKDRDEDVYVIADDRVVLEKTKQALRHVDRTKKQKRESLQTDVPSTGARGMLQDSQLAPLGAARHSLPRLDQVVPSRNLREVFTDGLPRPYAQAPVPLINSATLALQANNLTAGLNLDQPRITPPVQHARQQLGLLQQQVDGVLGALPDAQLANAILRLDASDYARSTGLNGSISAHQQLTNTRNALLTQNGLGLSTPSVKPDQLNVSLLNNQTPDAGSSSINSLVSQVFAGLSQNSIMDRQLSLGLPGNIRDGGDALSHALRLSDEVRTKETLERIQKLQRG